jgi:ATP-binding cassette subfamily F protein 3
MLDEPTNHLDMHSCDLLIDALKKYEGSLILVSHDRYFIAKTANKIWEIVDHQIKEFKGGYDEWVQWKERMQKAESAKNAEEKNAAKDSAIKTTETKSELKTNKAPAAPPPAPASKETKKELQKQQRLFQQAEEKLAGLNKKKASLEASMTDPANYADKNKFRQIETDYNTTTKEIAVAEKQYEEIFEKIIALEKPGN